MRPLAVAAAVVVAAAAPAVAAGVRAAYRGDLTDPLEGWALVTRWHLGSVARSVREGWFLREYRDAGWKTLVAGARLPEATSGTWLRGSFVVRTAPWRSFVLSLTDAPGAARVFLNGRALSATAIAEGSVPLPRDALRNGTNVLAVFAGAASAGGPVPRAGVTGISTASGRERPVTTVGRWRFRHEDMASELSADWLRRPDATDWRVALAQPPGPEDGELPDAPLCAKAILDFPPLWRKRPVSAFLHGLPGAPDLYVNGVLAAERVRTPARVDLAGRIKFDGRDTLCLVYAGPPRPDGGPLAESRSTDLGPGVVALHWTSWIPGNDLAIRLETAGKDAQEGLRHAVSLAADLGALSASPFTLRLTEEWAGATVLSAGPVPLPPSGPAVVAAWPGAPFRTAELEAARGEIAARVAELAGTGMPVWLVAPPPVGRKVETPVNTRLRSHNVALRGIAGHEGAGFVPAFEVFRSAMKRARRSPVRPEYVSDSGRLTPLGCYLLALTLIDTFPSAP